DNSSAVLFALDFDHNVMHNISYPNSGFDGVYHYNGVYMDPNGSGKTVGYIRNSVMYDVSGGANMAYPNGRFASTYIYNNVFFGQISAQDAIEIDPYDYGANTTSGNYYIYNNTAFVLDNTPFTRVVPRGPSQPASVVFRNNQVIGNGVNLDD